MCMTQRRDLQRVFETIYLCAHVSLAALQGREELKRNGYCDQLELAIHSSKFDVPENTILIIFCDSYIIRTIEI